MGQLKAVTPTLLIPDPTPDQRLLTALYALSEQARWTWKQAQGGDLSQLVELQRTWDQLASELVREDNERARKMQGKEL